MNIIKPLVIWDVDGVMVDSEKAHRQKLERLAAQNGAMITKQDWAHLHGRGDHYTYQWLRDSFAGSFDISYDDFAYQAFEFYKQSHLVRPRAGVSHTVRTLKTMGVAQAIVTNGDKACLDLHLKILGLGRDDFIYVMDATDAEMLGVPKKPHPGALIYVAQQARIKGGFHASKTILVEDSPNTLDVAKRLGWICVQCEQAPEMGLPLSQNADHIVLNGFSPLPILSAIVQRPAPVRPRQLRLSGF